MADESIVERFVGTEDCRAATVGDGEDVDGVAVIVVEEEDVVVAGAGRDNEPSC